MLRQQVRAQLGSFLVKMKNNKEVVVAGDGKCLIVSYWLWFLGVHREGVFIWLASSFNRSFVYN